MAETKPTQRASWHALAGEFYFVDVGSRGGFPAMSLLHPLIHMYSLDADPEATPPPQSFASFHHFPLALHSSEGDTDLLVAARPGMSSLLEFDEEAFARHFGLMAGSAAWKRYQTLVERRKTQVLRADDFFRSQQLERVDFLKLDTQGTELEILRGAQQYLGAGRVSVIKTEVSFHRVYRGQCLFGEIDHFLRQHGFEFIDCMFYPDAVNAPNSERAIHGVNLSEAHRFSSGGDAVYSLRPERYVVDRAGSGIRSAIVLNQMGYVSFAFDLLKRCGHTADFAECMLQATAMKDHRTRLKLLLRHHLSPWAYGKVQRLRRFLAPGS